MIYPENANKLPVNDAKLAGKYRMNNIRSFISLLYLIFRFSNNNSEVHYTDGQTYQERVKLNPDLKTKIETYLGIRDIEALLSDNPLIKGQCEFILVALERLFKLGTVELTNSTDKASERTGGNRNPKIIRFSSGMLVLNMIMKSFSDNILKESLIDWLKGEQSRHKEFENSISLYLTISLQESLFLFKPNEDSKILFRTNNIYHELIKGEEVSIKDFKGQDGTLSIYTNYLKEQLDPWMRISNDKIISKESDSLLGIAFDDFVKMIDIYLQYSLIKEVDLKSLGNYSGEEPISILPEQKIYFGTPGSGKSWTIKKQYEMSLVNGEYVEDNEKKNRVFRTTFHPDTDYSSFVGCYKPIMEGEQIKYNFEPQVFLEAYINAWNNLGDDKQYYLVIEEINRGNCAQIFGDLFQLLDRNCNTGYSEYPIKADMALRFFLENNEGNLKLTNKQGINNGELRLPPNLNIIASMNTSDQSLFPMDSAFKRRWNWEYVPIQYDEPHSSSFKIDIPGSPFDKWVDFLVKINKIILEKTDSEDKQMGNFFVKGDVSEKEFKDKVMFYLWSEICKDLYQTNDNFFRADLGGDSPVEFSFNMLYEKDEVNYLLGFLKYINQYKLKGE